MIKVLIFFSVISFYSCSSSEVQFNHKFFNERIPENRGIILTCVRCGCIPEKIQVLIDKDSIPINVALLADTTCQRLKGYVIREINQHTIDSISLNFFNAVIFKRKENGDLIIRIIQTLESERFGQILINFFSE